MGKAPGLDIKLQRTGRYGWQKCSGACHKCNSLYTWHRYGYGWFVFDYGRTMAGQVFHPLRISCCGVVDEKHQDTQPGFVRFNGRIPVRPGVYSAFPGSLQGGGAGELSSHL